MKVKIEGETDCHVCPRYMSYMEEGHAGGCPYAYDAPGCPTYKRYIVTKTEVNQVKRWLKRFASVRKLCQSETVQEWLAVAALLALLFGCFSWGIF